MEVKGEDDVETMVTEDISSKDTEQPVNSEDNKLPKTGGDKFQEIETKYLLDILRHVNKNRK